MPETTLDVIELGAQAIVTDRVRDSLKYESQYEPSLRATTINSFMRLAGQRFPEKRFEYPSTWWDALKERWYPAWALRRWPAARTVVTWSPKVVYPLIALTEEPRWEILDVFKRSGADA